MTNSNDTQMAFVQLAPCLRRHNPALYPHRRVSCAPLSSPPRRPKSRCVFATAAVPSDPDNEREQPPLPDPEPSETPASSSKSPDPIDATVSRLQGATEAAFEALFSPVIGSCSVLQRLWCNVAGNYVLRPTKPAKAVLHFLGGAFFAAAPHIVYRTFLERLCDRGYVIVATPFEIGFNYLSIAAEIADKWERIETDLALDYGPLPVIGVGHSAGCVFHALGSSLFDDAAPKAANVLVSFNNRKAADAIPMYAQVVLPTAAGAVGVNDALPEDVRVLLRDLPQNIEAAVEGNVLTPKRLRENVLPSVKESRRLVEQFWPLLQEIVGRGPRVESQVEPSDDNATRAAPPSDGAKEFYPSPDEVEKSVSQLYAVEQTLVVQFQDDDLDDSDALATALRSRGDPVDVTVITMEGNHLTPLAQDLPDFTSALGSPAVQSVVAVLPGQNVAQSLLGVVGAAAQETMNALGLRELTALEAVIDEWISKGLEEDRF